jgi:hypothetical protein
MDELAEKAAISVRRSAFKNQGSEQREAAFSRQRLGNPGIGRRDACETEKPAIRQAFSLFLS